MDPEFSKEVIKLTKKYRKKYSVHLSIRKMQVKTTLRFYLIGITMAEIIKTTNIKFW